MFEADLQAVYLRSPAFSANLHTDLLKISVSVVGLQTVLQRAFTFTTCLQLGLLKTRVSVNCFLKALALNPYWTPVGLHTHHLISRGVCLPQCPLSHPLGLYLPFALPNGHLPEGSCFPAFAWCPVCLSVWDFFCVPPALSLLDFLGISLYDYKFRLCLLWFLLTCSCGC